jgi:hypothetical protein
MNGDEMSEGLAGLMLAAVAVAAIYVICRFVVQAGSDVFSLTGAIVNTCG